MDIISRYVSRDYLITFTLSLLVFTFVLSIGAVVKAIDLLARGVSGMVILKVFLSAIPYLLSFSIPISALTSALLVFTRLSLEGEISAMKACGLSIWQIVAAPVMLSIALSLVAVTISGWIAPRSHFARREILQQIGVEEPAALLEEGRFVRDFPGFIIYVGHKEGHKLTDIIVYEVGGKSRRNVRARRGVLRPDPTNRVLYVDLYDVRIEQSDARHPMDLDRTRYITARYYPVRLDFSELQKTSELRKKRADMTLVELIHAIRQPGSHDPDLRPRDILRRRVDLLIEANKRLSLALSTFAFTVLGIPLGMISRRKESSVGVAIALAIVLVYYLFVIIAQSLVEYPRLHPELIVWIPVIGAELIGFGLMWRYR